MDARDQTGGSDGTRWYPRRAMIAHETALLFAAAACLLSFLFLFLWRRRRAGRSRQPAIDASGRAPSSLAEGEKAQAASLRERLARTRDGWVGAMGALLVGRTVDAQLLEELESLLFGADLGVATVERLLDLVKREASGKDAGLVRRLLRDAILERLKTVEPDDDTLAVTARPHVILVLGVNGSGKTTTIAKLAARYVRRGKRVILGAGDTFRAAAIEQLESWGRRVGCEVVSGQAGGDPAAVAFDTVKAAVARGVDVAIIDTAGRLQTRQPLMQELGKIARVIGRELPGAPHECLLVLDANTGQNAISQAKLFSEVADVSGLVLTKLDGTAKGGVIVGLAETFGIPVKFVGVGENETDLRDFDAEEFVAALFGDEGESTATQNSNIPAAVSPPGRLP